jgi:hypothetical protein
MLANVVERLTARVARFNIGSMPPSTKRRVASKSGSAEAAQDVVRIEPIEVAGISERNLSALRMAASRLKLTAVRPFSAEDIRLHFKKIKKS